MNASRTYTTLALAIAAATGLSLPVALPVYANPEGATVVSGEASLQQIAPGQLEIRNSAGAIINWHDFSVGEGEATRFIQPSAASAVLNRVVGQNPSQILGQLASNGRVFLINQNGIVFGAGAKIDTAGLVASTLNITDEDFLAGRLQFEGGNGKIDNSSIENWGLIQAGPRGEIVLIAPEVTNHGVLSVVGGQLILAAGQKVRLASLNIDDVTVEVRAPTNQALNLGQLIAERGAIGLLGSTVTNNGLISATSLSRDAQGRVVLSASGSLGLGKDSSIDVSGARGGDIRITANDTALVRGSLNATGTGGMGGGIDITAPNTGLFGDVRIDASGATGGGRVRVGGGFQGQAGDIANATHTVVERGARIAANATERGRGGEVVLWANDSMRFMGDISARGGLQSGNGGNVEVSGHERLGFDGTVDVGASAGTGGLSGQILLDPNNGTIVTGSAPSSDAADGVILFGDAAGTDLSISEGALEALTGNVDLQFQQNLTVNSGVRLDFNNQTNGELVSFRAGGNLTMNGANISTGGANLLLSAGDSGAISPLSTATLGLTSGAIDVTNLGGQGNVTLRSGGSGGVVINGFTFTLGTGNLTFDTAGAQTIVSSTINGGTLLATGATTALTALTGNNALNGVTLDMDLIVGNFSNLDTTAGLTIASGRVLRLTSNATLRTRANETYSGPGTIQFEGGNSLSGIFSNQVLTLGSGLTIQGGGTGGGTIGAGFMTINNGATIQANAGQTLSLTNVVNQGAGAMRANGGTLNLLGTTTPAALTGLTNIGGTINLNGTLNNTGNTFLIDSAIGVINLNGGTISGGTIQKSGTGDLILTADSTLAGVTLDMDFTVPTGRSLATASGLTISAGRTLHLAGNSVLRSTNNETYAGPGTIQFEGTNSLSGQFGGQVLNLSNGLTIRGLGTGGGSIGAGFFTINNAGTIQANSGQTLTLTNVLNDGETGVQRANGGTLNIAGTPTTADLFGLTNVGGTINLTGSLDNTGNTFLLDSFTGVVNLNGGTITGGTIQKSGTGDLVLTANSNLVGVTLDMDFIIPDGRNIRTSGGLTVATGRTLRLAGNSSLTSTTNETYSGPGTIQFEGSNSLSGQFSGQVLNFTSGLTVQGLGTGGGSVGSSFFTINNSGTIQAGSGQTLTASGIVNQTSGVLRTNAGTLNLAGSISNPGGTLDLINAGTLNLNGTISNFGTLNRPGGNGTINLNGTLNNAGTTFVFSNTTGVINLNGGTISGGTLQKSGTGDLVQTANSSLSGVTLDMDFIIPDGRNIRTSGGLTVAAGRTLRLAGNSSLTSTTNETYSGPGTIQFEGSNSLSGQFSGQVLNFTGGLTLQGFGTGSGSVGSTFFTINNSATIQANSGQSITAVNIVNQTGGVLRANAGTLALGGAISNPGGTLDLINAGTLSLNGTISNFGTLNRPGGNGTINLNGTLNNAGTTFVFSSTTGVINLNGGTISGGTLQKSGTGDLVQTANSSLSGVTLDMDFIIPDGRNIRTSGGLTVAAGRMLRLAGNSSLTSTTNETYSGPGTIQFEGSNSLSGQFSGQVLNFTGGLTLQGFGTGSGSIGSTFFTINNSATIQANSGQSITATNIVNQTGGVLRANAGTLALAGAISNPGGTLDLINAGTLNLNGTISNFGTLNRPGGNGTINLNGTLNNTGTTFVFNDTTGVINLNGGTISGGTIQKSGTGDLILTANSVLSGVTLDMDFIIPTARNIRTSSGLTVASGRTLHLEGNSTLTSTTNETYSGPGTIQFEGSNSLSGQFSGQVLNFTGGLTLQGLGTGSGSGSIGSTFFTINNSATIQANSGQSITATNIVNQTGGVLRANAGSLALAGAISNPGGTLDLINAGTLNLNGTISNFGTLNRPGGNGTINLNGTLNNTGTTFVFNDTTGVINFNGGTISGGTIQKTGAGDLILTANSVLSGVTLDMDFIIPTGRNIRTSSGLTVASGRTLHLEGNSTLTSGANETYTGPGTIQFEGTNSFSGQFSGQVVNFASGLTVQGLGTGGGSVGATFFTINNAGTIQADSGQSITATNIVNQTGGVLRANAGTLSLAGTISNPGGTLDLINAGTLSLNGTISNFGTLTRPGGNGTINLNGTLNNTGTTFVFNDTTGVINLNGGAISGGTLQKSGTGDLILTANSTLSGVTLDMDFIIPTARNIRTSGGLTVASGRTLHLEGTSTLTSTTNETYTGPGTIQFEGTNSLSGQFSGQVLNFAGGLTFQGFGTGGGSIGAGFFTINNAATIQANSGQSITATNIVNQSGGVLRANAGTLNLAGAISNSGGALDLINAGTLNLNGTISNFGTLTRPGGNGTINLNGTLNNTGTTFVFNDTTGVINLNGGTISGGTLQKSGTGDLILTANSTLSGVTLDMDFITPTARNIRTSSGLTVASGRTLRLAGNSSLTTTTNETYGGPGTIQFEGTNSISGQFSGQVLTLGAGLQIATLANTTGTVSATFMSVINQGSISAGANSALTFAGSTATNNGSIVLGSGATLSWLGTTLANNGSLDIGANGTLNISNVNLTNNGTISGNGRIDLTTDATFEDLINNGTIRPGTSPGLLTIDGDLVLNTSSVLDIEVQGRARVRQYDAIDVLGAAQLAGTVNVTHLAPYSPVDGHSFRVLTSTGTRTGTFTTVNTPVPYNTQYVGSNVLLQVGANPQAVNFWLNNTSGNYGTGSNWSLGSAPVAGQIVIIDRAPADITVTVDSAQVTGNLFNTETLALTTNTLNVTDDSLIDLDGTLNIAGGTLSGKGPLGVDGIANITSGSLNTTLNVSTVGRLNISGSTAKSINGGTVNNSGAATLSGTGVVNVGNGTAINNLAGGTLSIAPGSAVQNSLGGATATFDNAGALSTTGTGTATLGGITFTNAATGVLNVDSNLTLTGTGSNAGSIVLSASRTLEVADGFSNTGTIAGRGTVRVGSGGTGTLSNAGTLDPNGSGGTNTTLTVTGNLNFTPTGVLAIELSNNVDAHPIELLEVSGALNLASGATLNATLFGGFTPIASDRFTFVTAGSTSGSFGGTLPGGLILQNGVTSLLLRLPGGSSCAGTLCFDNSAGDFLWSNPINWDADRLPDINDDVRIDLSTATLVLLNGGDFTITNLLVTPGNGLRLTGGNLFITGNATINGLLALAGGSLQLGGITSAAMFDFSSGNLIGAGRLTSSAANWTGGRSTLADWSIAPGTSLNIAGSTEKILDGGVLNNRGTVNLSGAGSLSTGGGAVINNLADATFVLGNGAQVLFNRPGAVSQFNNAGFMTTDPGTGATLDGLTFSNTGSLNLNSNLAITGAGSNAGVISLLSSDVRLQVADGFTNSGQIVGTGSVQVGPGSTGTLINSGALTTEAEGGAATLNIEGNLDVTSTGSVNVSLSGAPTISFVDRLAITRTLTIANGATLNAQLDGTPRTGDTYNVVTAGSIVGTFTSTPPGGLVLTSGATSIGFSLPGGITCAGSICFDNDDGDALWTNPRNWSTNALPGASDDVRIDLGIPVIVLLNSGNFSITQLLITNGNGLRINGGSLLVSGGAVFDGTLELISGLLGGNSFVFNNTFSWTGGTFSGDAESSTTLGDGGSIVFTGSGDRVLTGRAISVDSLSLPDGSLSVQGNGALTARLNLDILTGATLIQNGGSIDARGDVANAGTLRVLTGNLVLAGNGTHSGVFDVAPTASLRFGGEQSFANGSRLQGGGAFEWDEADIAVDGAVQISGTGTRLSIADSAVAGAGNLSSAAGTTVVLSSSDINSSGTLSFAGTVDWQGGSIAGTLNTSGSTTLTGAETKSLASGVWNNTGTVTWTAGNLNITAGSVFNNQSGGSFVANLVDVDAAMTGSGVFNNLSGAQFTQQAEGESCRIAPTFTNAGLLVLNGDLQILRAFTNNGVLRIASGATLSSDAEFNGSQFGNGASGRVEGNGSIDAASSGVAFSNAGTVAPGASPGRLRILGNYVQTSTGVLDVELNDSTPITGYDVLDITGSAVLGGTLRIRTPDGAVFSPGASFDVLRYGSVSGDFASTEQPARGSLVATVGLTQYSLQLAANNEPFLAPERSVLVMTAPEQLPNALVDLLAPTEDPVQFIARRRGGACN